MTTDLTDDFGLGEEEFDWDVFLPDPDETEIAAEAAALEDEAELNLDDSDFDWEAALREGGDPENGAGDSARAGAAYDRIVDTVRRSFEDPEPEAEAGAEAQMTPVVRGLETASVVPEPADDAEPFAPRLEVVAQPESDLEPEWASELESEPSEVTSFALADLFEVDDAATEIAPETRAEPDTTPEWGPAVSFVAVPEAETAAEFAPEQEWDRQSDMTFAAEPEPDPEVEPDPAVEPFSTLVEPAAVAATVWAAEPPPDTPSDPGLAWVTVPAEVAQDAGAVDPDPDLVEADVALDADEHGDETGTEKRRSRVFTATIVLGCLFLVVVAAAVGVRALRHQPTSSPPAHAAPPVHAAPPPSSHRNAAGPSKASASTVRIQGATDAVDSATTAASVGLASLSAVPTPTNVETVINPFISSLQLYAAVLAGSKMPAAAQPAAASAEAQLRQDLQFLDTIDGLPAGQLGAYLTQFDADATRLQTTLSTLEQNLRASTS